MMIRTAKHTRIFLSILLVGFLFSIACNKQDTSNINPQTSSLGYILANGTNTTIFYSAVVKGGLDSLFYGPSIFTLMVPTDQACNVSGFSQSVINGFSYDQARQWVLYQTYAGTALAFESFIGKTEEKLIMANGDSIFVSGDSNRTYVNGFQFLNSEAAGTNGTMLAMQNVLVPPTQNLDQMLNTDTSLTFFNQAVSLATPVPDTLSKTLATGGPFTLLAPNNDAFRLLGYNSPADISSISPDSLRTLVLTSLIPQRLFSYDVVD
ncbi:MAG TPA: fasciclin domain-containing protein, partial [Puia sp.]|nr:fasciclin domain-containing protein [Puia sp.]